MIILSPESPGSKDLWVLTLALFHEYSIFINKAMPYFIIIKLLNIKVYTFQDIIQSNTACIHTFLWLIKKTQ